MKLQSFLLLIIILLTSSCNQQGNGIDKKDLIERDRMVRLMADMQITEVALRQKQSTLNHDTMKIISNKAYDSLYLFYKTSPESFKSSLKYYQQDLEDYLKMNEEVITLLTQKEDSIKQEKEAIPDTTASKDTAKASTIKQETVKGTTKKQPEKVVIDIKKKPSQVK